ncbi:MAG: hypothetical protein VX641_07640 [Planctomycetota bacterium]|nr:hypothetical protein [Planctomycetota bacterium]
MARIPVISSLLLGLLASVALALPPLDATSRAILTTAVDDRDHQEAAFSVLVEELLRRAGEPAGSTGSLLPAETWAILVESPDDHRGIPLVLEGRVEQRTELARPWDTMCELFVRLPDERVVAVFVPASDEGSPGDRARFEGRFYKRLSAVARDGMLRRYPAVVARRVPAASRQPMAYALPALLLGLGFCWIVLRRLAGASRTRRRMPAGPRVVGGSSPNDPELPDEPARALDVLRSRHDHPDKGGAS